MTDLFPFETNLEIMVQRDEVKEMVKMQSDSDVSEINKGHG